MAKYKNITGEKVDARFLDRFLDVDEIVEIPDEIAVQYDFSPEIWKETTPPKPAAIAAHKRAIAAAHKAADEPTETPGTNTDAGDTTKTEEV
jgi:hypothetical protein